MHVSVRERNTVTRKALIKPAMAIAGGGCGRPATILTTLQVSTLAAPSIPAVTVSAALVTPSGPLCGLILDNKIYNRRTVWEFETCKARLLILKQLKQPMECAAIQLIAFMQMVEGNSANAHAKHVPIIAVFVTQHHVVIIMRMTESSTNKS